MKQAVINEHRDLKKENEGFHRELERHQDIY